MRTATSLMESQGPRPEGPWPEASGSGGGAGRIGIVRPAHGHDYDEAVSVLAAVVREWGGEVLAARDGDPSVLEADAIILFGRCSAFDASARLLGAHSRQRPPTVLWHVEPLPPGVIPAQAESTAMRLARCDVNRLPEPLAVLVRCVPGHGFLLDVARGVLSKRLAGAFPRDGLSGRPAWGREWTHAVQHILWLKERYAADWCDVVATGTASRCGVLAQMGIPCEYAPFGYHPLWGTDRQGDRDIDVVFLGRSKRTGRQTLLRRIERQLAAAGKKLLVVDHGCYGEQRTELLNRARISLDLSKNPWEMPLLRPLVSAACGALVVSNHPLDPSPFRDEHLVRVDSEALGATILEYLRNEGARRQITEAAARHLRSDLAWPPVVSRVLRRARALRGVGHGATV